MLATVGSRYQIVIPKEVRMKVKGLRPGDRVVISQSDGETLSRPQINVHEKQCLMRLTCVQLLLHNY